MKKYVVLFALALMVALPVLASAQDALSLLEEKAAAGDSLRAARDYTEGLVIPYAVNDGQFSSGIAVYNSAAEINTFLIASFATDGTMVASGSFSLLPGTSAVNMIDGFIDEGSAASPSWGFTGIFATAPFIADRFIFQAGGGFGELTMESKAY